MHFRPRKGKPYEAHTPDPDILICDPGFFKLAYRLEAVRAARNGGGVRIALLTLAPRDGSAPPPHLLNAAMGILFGAIKAGLRKGGAVSRYSGAQYALMLPTAEFGDGQAAVDRISWIFSMNHPRSQIQVSALLFQPETTG
jgi:hypothetical protein